MPLVVTEHGSEIPNDQIKTLEAVIAEAMVDEASAIGPEEAVNIPNTDAFGFLSYSSRKKDQSLTVKVYLYKRESPRIHSRYWQAVNDAIKSLGLTGDVTVQEVPPDKWRGWLAPST